MLLVILVLTYDVLERGNQGHMTFNSILETVHVRHVVTINHVYAWWLVLPNTYQLRLPFNKDVHEYMF
jgi:hypothetical protein